MASDNGCNDLRVRVVSRRVVKASDSSIKPYVLAFSNIDLLMQHVHLSGLVIYPKPLTADFKAVIAVFEANLPSLLNHFFPFAGRMATNTTSGIPEVHRNNQGAELVVGEAVVPLASLDYGTMTASLRKIHLPYGEDLALSVQLVPFACGGFAVVFHTNHMLVDGSSLSFLASAWSELARSGTLAAGSRPNHDRSIFRPRAALSCSASLDDALTILNEQRQVNVLTTDQSFVERLYYVEASDIAWLRDAASKDGQRATRVQAVSAYLWKALASVVGTADKRCRMAWRVNGRWKLTAPKLRAAMRNYVGNVTTLPVREASVQEILRMPLPEVAALVGEAITEPSFDEHIQEMVDWVEDHKPAELFAETALLGLGSPMLRVTAMSSFRIDADFGFGRAALMMSIPTCTARFCSGSVQIMPGPGDDGSWIVSASVWPRLAAALESDKPCIFKPVTAEYLGLVAPRVQHCRL